MTILAFTPIPRTATRFDIAYKPPTGGVVALRRRVGFAATTK